MLDKLIIHIKNVIFFKSVIYVLLIIILSMLIPMFQEELVTVSSRHEKAVSFLKQARFKLQSIANFEKKIPGLTERYQLLEKKSSIQGCLSRFNIINSLNMLTKKYQLFEPIDIKISRLFEKDNTLLNQKVIKINEYELIIKFNINDKGAMLKLIEEIYSFLPIGSIIIKVEINKMEALTPQIINTLSELKSPGLFKVFIIIHIREIVYEK